MLVRTCVTFLVVDLIERSVPSSSLSFSLYKLASFLFILYFLQGVCDQSAPVYLGKLAHHPPSVPVIYTSFLLIFNW